MECGESIENASYLPQVLSRYFKIDVTLVVKLPEHEYGVLTVLGRHVQLESRFLTCTSLSSLDSHGLRRSCYYVRAAEKKGLNGAAVHDRSESRASERVHKLPFLGDSQINEAIVDQHSR